MEDTQISNSRDIRRLAVGVLHINVSKALLDFPGTTRAHPSRWVIVNLAYGGPLEESFRQYFPFKVIWYLWEDVLVPVLEDPAYQVMTSTGSLRNQINLQSLRDKDYETLLSRIEGGIVLKMQEKGYLPGGDSSSGTGESSTENPSGTSGVESVRWPEGHLRLDYPVVV